MTNKTYGKVSIITPTYNSSKFVGDCIKSIIAQTYQNWELLITDDCSTDDTLKVIEKWSKLDNRISILKLNVNSGPAVARNHSILNASGRWIAFCDSDDMWKPNKLHRQLEFMSTAKLALSYSAYTIISENGDPLSTIYPRPITTYASLLTDNCIGCLTAIYDTQLVGKVYMPKIRKRQDWALWLQILKMTPNAQGIPEPLAIHRKRCNSISSNKIKLLKFNWDVYRKIEGYSTLKSFFLIISFLGRYFFKKCKTVSHTINSSSH